MSDPASPPVGARPPVAFLGLGALGSPMAANLLQAGFPLTVWNRTRQAEEPLAAAGARRASTPAAAATGSELIALCLSDDAAVEEVLFGPDGVAGGTAAGGLVIDFSTIAPATSQKLASRLTEQGVGYLDAPVTGGTEGARAGSLSVLVGGAAADLERARSLLEVVGGLVSHFGAVGSGQQVKAVNQIFVAGSYAAVAEGLALARRLGLPLEQVCDAMRGGAAGSWALEHRGRNMIENAYPLGFRLALHRKDLAIALATAEAENLTLPISTTVAEIEDALIAAGHGDEDVSALARWFQLER
ncbi:MAG TPA: NAD(P)-dependent oxidoreductase [Cyanobium sp.]|nr:NAD(P)-dependent oxidoreductase [Cyanobium sp.]